MRGRAGGDPAVALREHLIDTVAGLLGERAISAVTTRDIARAAGVSDGVLYNYFGGKDDLVIQALLRRYSQALDAFTTGLPQPGTATVEENLTTYCHAVLDLVAQALPVAAGLMSEPALLHRFIVAVHTEPYGPRRITLPIVEYLTGERRLGRLGEFDTEAVVSLITGAAIVLVLSSHLGSAGHTALAERVPAMVETLTRGIRWGITDNLGHSAGL